MAYSQPLWNSIWGELYGHRRGRSGQSRKYRRVPPLGILGSLAGPTLWNSLPGNITKCININSLNHSWKRTFLTKRSINCCISSQWSCLHILCVICNFISFYILTAIYIFLLIINYYYMYLYYAIIIIIISMIISITLYIQLIETVTMCNILVYTEVHYDGSPIKFSPQKVDVTSLVLQQAGWGGWITWGWGYIILWNESRLQLKRGLFWYKHHPKVNEMVSDRSSQAENWTDIRKMSMHVFFGSTQIKVI